MKKIWENCINDKWPACLENQHSIIFFFLLVLEHQALGRPIQLIHLVNIYPVASCLDFVTDGRGGGDPLSVIIAQVMYV